MCYHRANAFYWEDLVAYYNLVRQSDPEKEFEAIKHYHVNGFDHSLTPVLAKLDGLGMMQWGLIPWYTKSVADAMAIRTKTLNAISEEMFDKPSFRDSLKDGKRCLIPTTGFYEWQWMDKAGREKQPYFIHLKDQEIFSMAGIYSSWKNPESDQM